MKIRNGTMKAWHCFLLLFLCIAVNFGGKTLASFLCLPVWLDMIGTCVAVYCLGLPYGIITAVLNNAIFSIIDSTSLVYGLVSAACAVVFELCVRKGYMEKPSSMFFSSFLIAFSSAAVSVPLNLIFYEGYSGNMWGDALFDMLMWYDADRIPAAVAGEAVVDVLDKQICLLVCGLLIFGVKRMKKDRAQGKGAKAVGKTVLSLLLALSMGTFLPVMTAGAQGAPEKTYNSRIYNNQNGMMSSEANVIAETDDGFIWIGSYAGLTRYNGTKFEFIREGGIVSVTAMLCDSAGRLWIGTNDGGIARYEKGQFTFFRAENGLPSNSVRCFCEGEGGKIYVGTTDKACAFGEDDKIEILSDEVYYIMSMAFYNGYLVCVGNDRNIYAIGDTGVSTLEGSDDLRFTCVSLTGGGVLAATEMGGIYDVDADGGRLSARHSVSVPLRNIQCIAENSGGQIWLCADNGMGWLSDGIYHDGEIKDFSVSLENIHEDYQGNIWVASSRCGVLCLSPTPFMNLFTEYGADSAVCNAVAPYNGGWCAGTDNGLVMLDSGGAYKTELTEMLEGARVRCIMKDREGGLWICTYSEYGLVRMTADGKITTYTTSDPLVTSDRARCAAELSDGTIAVGTADGIYFVKNGAVTGNITRADGLVNSQILTLTEGSDGALYAGSDGAGLFVIRDGAIVGNYTAEDGLSSDVILRITRCSEGLLLVTSNSLNLLSPDGMTVLTEFPYYNNYDVLINGEKAYVLSSAGIFSADVSEICANKEPGYSLYNVNYGLESAVTANSWSYIGDSGELYVCCNDGVVRFTPQETGSPGYDYKYGISSVTCDGNRVFPENGAFSLPKNAANVTIEGAVYNFALNGLKVKFFEEGAGIPGEIVPYSEIEPLRINRPASGEHIIRFQLFDSSGKELISESAFTVTKEMQIWENWWYRAYLIFMCAEIVVFVIWTFVLIIDDQRKKQALARFNTELEEKVLEQTQVIRTQTEQKEELLSQTVFALANAVDAKDNYTSGHSRRVAEYAMLIAGRMGKSAEEQEEIFRAGLLHDVGKIRIPERIINKPGKLTDDEFALIKLHPITGYHILKGVASEKIFADGARFHHERYDGKGYPNGLAGTRIPEIARIIGIADAYDAMASRRSYRDTMPQEAVRAEIERCSGTQFDPDIARIMLTLIDEDKDYKMKETKPPLKRILAVDDEQMNIKLISFALKDIDHYAVTSAESGTAALEALRGGKFDIALIDIKMPDMDGYETVAKIREFSEVPVVFMTVDRNSIDTDELKKYGVTDFITKPFMPAALKEVLHAVLSE